MQRKIYLSTPHLSGFELKYIQEAFDKNWITTIGENINEFENDLQKFLNRDKEVVALNTCTAALHLALIECGVGHGDEVIC